MNVVCRLHSDPVRPALNKQQLYWELSRGTDGITQLGSFSLDRNSLYVNGEGLRYSHGLSRGGGLELPLFSFFWKELWSVFFSFWSGLSSLWWSNNLVPPSLVACLLLLEHPSTTSSSLLSPHRSLNPPSSLIFFLCIIFFILFFVWKWKCQSFSHVWLFATPRTVARQAPLSMEFSRQEYWSGLPFSSSGSPEEPRDWT